MSQSRSFPSLAWVIAGVLSLVSACAEGVASGLEAESSALQSPVMEQPDAGPPASAAGMGALPMQEMPVMDDRVPCTQGDVGACICEDKGTEGQQTCVFDTSSPLGGYFSECTGCPDPVEPCSDGEMNGNESDIDCGGGSCQPCAEGSTCNMNIDCAQGICTDGVCGPPPDEPDPPMDTGGNDGGGSSSGCDPSMCTGALACCTLTGSCGTGVGPLCF